MRRRGLLAAPWRAFGGRAAACFERVPSRSLVQAHRIERRFQDIALPQRSKGRGEHQSGRSQTCHPVLYGASQVWFDEFTRIALAGTTGG
jgi:hypothetical protein